MGRRKKAARTCAVVGCFDTETVNVPELKRSMIVSYQLGTREYGQPGELVSTNLYRHELAAYDALDQLARRTHLTNQTPVVMVHNLAYDVYFIMRYIYQHVALGAEVGCCFKSSIKPLSIQIKYPGESDPYIVLWDTLSFSGMGLARMGAECGFDKSQDWDYSLKRTPNTPLTPEEEEYALRDVIVPFMWLDYWRSINPDVDVSQIGVQLLTKTSVVRQKTRKISEPSGAWAKYLHVCDFERPKTAFDYNHMIKATSAGWTFTSGKNAGREVVGAMKYDACSMHPSHIISHKYPTHFRAAKDMETVKHGIERVMSRDVEWMLAHWERPFDIAFNARIKFTNLRPKANSIFAKDDVMLHGSGLFRDYSALDTETLDDELAVAEVNAINAEDMDNRVENPVYSMNKLVSADTLIITLNELNAWVHAQVYEWDGMEVLSCSGTAKYRRAPAHMMLAVGTMLERKATFKRLKKGILPSKRPEWVAPVVWEALQTGDNPELVESAYLAVKADLNSLYGMFATNEFKQSIVYMDDTFKGDGIRGVDKDVNCKAWYQAGLRIAAWSRVEQCTAMLMLNDAGCIKHLVNGDTDSFCFEPNEGITNAHVTQALAQLHSDIERSIGHCSYIVKDQLPKGVFNGLGSYEVDCIPETYCAVANKRYAYTVNGETRVHVASAGLPNASAEGAIQAERANGAGFAEAVILALGYDVTYSCAISGFRARNMPSYGELTEKPITVTDYLGQPYEYPAGSLCGIYLYESTKCLGRDCDKDFTQVCQNAGIPKPRAHWYTTAPTDEGTKIFRYQV